MWLSVFDVRAYLPPPLGHVLEVAGNWIISRRENAVIYKVVDAIWTLFTGIEAAVAGECQKMMGVSGDKEALANFLKQTRGWSIYMWTGSFLKRVGTRKGPRSLRRLMKMGKRKKSSQRLKKRTKRKQPEIRNSQFAGGFLHFLHIHILHSRNCNCI